MKAKKSLKLCLLPLLTIAVAVGVVHAKEGDVYSLQADSSLRKGPDSFYVPTGSAAKGARAIELNSAGAWKKVRIFSSGDVGWINSASLSGESVNVGSSKVVNDNVGTEKSTLPAVVVNNDLKLSPKPAADLSPQFESGTPAVSGPTDVALVDQKQVPPSKPVVQEMTPSKDHVDGGRITPLFEDGAVSQEIAPERVADQPVASAEQMSPAIESAQKELPVSVQAELAKSEPMLDPDNTGLQQFPVQLVSSSPNEVDAPVAENVIKMAAKEESAAANTQTSGDMARVPAAEQSLSAPENLVSDTARLEVEPIQKSIPASDAMGNVGVKPEAALNNETKSASSGPLNLAVEPTQKNIPSSDVMDSAEVKPVSAPDKNTKIVASEPLKLAVEPTQKNIPASDTMDSVEAKPVAARNNDVVTIANTETNEPVGASQMVMQTTVIRVGPSALSEVLGWAGSGARVQTIQQDGKWMKVRLQDSGRIGWVEAASLDGSNVVATSVVMTNKPTSEPVIEAVNEPVNKPINEPAPVNEPEQLVQKAPVEPLTATDLNSSSTAKAVDTAAVTPDKMVENQGEVQAMPQQTSPNVETTRTEVVPAKSEKATYTFNRTAALRDGPATTFDSVSWAGAGAQATELERKGDWVRLQLQVSKRIGWVYDQSLNLVAAGAGVASSAAAASAPSASLTVLPVQMTQTSDQKPSIATPVRENIKADPVIANVEPKAVQATDIKKTSSAIHKLYSFNEKANLRAGPAVTYDVVSWAGVGAYALEQDRNGDWLRVQLQANKRIGWVNMRLLTPVKAGATAQAAITANADAAPAVVMNADKAVKLPEKSIDDSDHKLHFFKQTSTLRAGPGKEFEKVAWGGRNESAVQIGHSGDWKQVRMTISGKTGWVFNEYLVRAMHPGHIMGVTRSMLSPAVKSMGKNGQMYLVVRTVPLRAAAGDLADLIGSVQKGDLVAWLEERNGWVRVNPQIDGGKIGWIEANLLRKQEQFNVERTQALIGKDNMLSYKDRISKGEVFNFSYAALEEALYKIPVEDIHIRISKDNLEAIFLKRQYDLSPFEMRLTTGRHRLSGTIKVLGSSTRIFKKKSLLIKLDKESARWYGHRRMALRSMASDKALMREWMTWKMMAALGMKVPEVHFTRVTFNKGEKTGLYLSIEWMGKEFLEGNNLDTRGEFYQPNDGAHCGDLYSPESVELCFDKITPFGDFSNLKSMAKSVNAATNENIDTVLAKYFEDESIINWIAVNALVTNGDTYNKNYWLYYHPTKEKWTVVPWDYNLTFGRTYDQYATRKFRIFNDNFQYYYPPDVGAGNPIKDKVLRNPALRKRLEEKIKHLTGMEPNGSEQTFGWFSPTVMQARIGNLASVVGKEVYKDSFLSYGEADFTKTYESLIHYVTAHDHFLKTKLFGDFPWAPEPPNQPYAFMHLPETLLGEGNIEAGSESLHMVDRSWGYFVAHLNLNEPLKRKAAFEVKIEGGVTPKYLPNVVQSASRCIERSWLLKTKTDKVSVTGDLMIEYTQENSRRSEVPPRVHEELLELWMLDGKRWKPIQTEVNEYSNTLTAKNVHVESGHHYRFVACSPF
ncbi:hypothetical protein D8Y20_07575 [Mariprofundus sp. EBB-1]|uniref:CotH kinase family protein n=1 Tax=Mariprofundus sp. EBB-1 TaxID=2650971 RepID=UPI000EF23AD3|nr:CotH kinase family protein [Mariprofundus sp. EBB-1]RLL52250.1 hypothetical protein D8Y20_07575 [Mariprofundus sp. EBB-1]